MTAPSAASSAAESLEEDVDDRVVGDELAAAHVPVGRGPERRPRRHRGAQEIAGSEDRNPEMLGQDRRLRPLPGPRSTEQDDDRHSNPGGAQVIADLTG